MTLRDMLQFEDDRRRPPPAVARYVADDGREFVLDRRGPAVLMKFENSAEVWVLEPVPAPRGDVIYRNDLGKPVLRATRLGGLTLFTPEQPSGAAAALAGEAGEIGFMPPVSGGGLLQKLAQASGKASQAAQHLIAFEAEQVFPGSEPLIADAAVVAAEAIVRLTQKTGGRQALAKIAKIVLVPGDHPEVKIKGEVIDIMVAPARGPAGRPSSERIVAALTR